LDIVRPDQSPINFLTLFLTRLADGIVLLLVNGMLFLLIFLYARIMGSVFLIQRKMGGPDVMSVLSFLVIQTILFALYSLITKFPLSPAERSYFTYNYGTYCAKAGWVSPIWPFPSPSFYPQGHG